VIRNIEPLLSQGDREIREILLHISDSLLREIRADRIMEKEVKVEGNSLIIMGNKIALDFRKIFLVGFGKASVPMAREMERILGDRIEEGIVNSPFPAKLERIKVNVASHPLPDEKTVKASQDIVELVKKAGKRDLVIVLVSGGASSLFELPVEGMSIEEEREIVKNAILGGMDIIQLNKLRISLSKVKGGKFLNYIHPAKCISLIISDVIGPPEYVGSGPTYPFGKGSKGCENFVLADNRYALEKAREIAEGMGIYAHISPTILQGEPRIISKNIIQELQEGITIWGGETTVKVNNGGKGGRNQELALYLAKEIKKKMGFICLGTDGIDGPTDAAGGVVDETTVERAKKLNIDLDYELSIHNSYWILKKLGDLIITGYTGTNLADICIAYVP